MDTLLDYLKIIGVAGELSTRAFATAGVAFGKLSRILRSSAGPARMKHFIDYIVRRFNDTHILQATEQAHGRNEMKIGWPVKDPQADILEQDCNGFVGLEVALKAAVGGDEVDHCEFSGVLLEFLSKPPLFSFDLAYVCRLYHESWRVAVDEIFDVGIFEVGQIAGQVVVDGVNNDNPHVQFKQEIKAIRHPQAVNRTRLRHTRSYTSSPHPPELGKGGCLVFDLVCRGKQHGKVGVSQRDEQIRIISQTEAANRLSPR